VGEVWGGVDSLLRLANQGLRLTVLRFGVEGATLLGKEEHLNKGENFPN
jgi:hypothetical protein